MKIKDKLYIGIVCYIVAGATVGTLIFWQFKLISEKLHVVSIVNDISNRMLEARRYEKNYLLYRREEDFNEFKNQMTILKQEVDDIRSEFVKQVGEDSFQQLNTSIEQYEDTFFRIVQNNLQQEQRLDQLLKYSSKVSEDLISSDPIKAAELNTTVRNFVINKSKDSYLSLVVLIDAFSNKEIAERYKVMVKGLYSLFSEEGYLIDHMRAKAREIQDFTVSFTNKEKKDIDQVIRRALIILLVAFLTALFTGLVVSIRFAITVINPLLSLEAITRRIADGDFPDKINEVKGNDELASLQRSFNVMIERLHQSMVHLDNAFRELKEKQRQLIEAEKLASVGILAAGIAHEISNPLTSVLTFSTLMLEKTPEGDPNREKLSLMVRETVRAREIVRQLLTFAKETPINLRPMDVNQPVAEAVKTLTEQGVFHDIELVMELSDQLPLVQIDPDRITQVMLNMLINATHAILKRPGRIELKTKRVDQWVEIIISDTGIGIPKEHLGRIFEPFFSTKEQTKGTGLGLAVSYGIIKKHGGTIEVSSKVGEGTTFTVRLPIDGDNQSLSS